MPRHPLRPLALALLVALPLPALRAQEDGASRPAAVALDTSRARLLYVSNRPEDHPVADYAAQQARKARTDSVFAARSAGRMRFRKVTYRSSADGLEIPASLFEPLTPRGPGAHPAMVWVHGGVHGNWDENYLPFILEAVERGYVIIAPDYRGSTGYGEAFHRAIDYGGLEVDDVASAVPFLRTLPHVDPARIGMMGWSHGGLITCLVAMRGAATPIVAAVAQVPVTNLLFRLSFKGPSYQRSFATQAGLKGLPFENREEYVRRSPYYHVDSLRIPLLVHVASNDTDVNFEEARPLIDALAARKPDLAETRIYWNPTPGPTSVGHTFARRVNRRTLEREDSPEQVDSWNRVWLFLERHLVGAGGRATTR